MNQYKQYLDRENNLACIVIGSKSIPIDPANTDYQEYLKWVAEGNIPEPADQS